MSNPLPMLVATVLGPALLLLLALAVVAGRAGVKLTGARGFAGSALLALAVVNLPVGGLRLGAWAASLFDHWSVPLLAVLTARVLRRFFGLALLRPGDERAAWWFGALAGVALYPAALGWGSFDPYSLGWHFGPLFVATAAVAGWCFWRENRLGFLLVLAVVAWHLGGLDSRNYWDYLLDPAYFAVSLAALARAWVRRLSRASRVEQCVA